MPCRERRDAHEDQALRGTDRLIHDDTYLPVLSQSRDCNAFQRLCEPQHRIDALFAPNRSSRREEALTQPRMNANEREWQP